MLFIYWFRKDLRISDNKGLSEFINELSAYKQKTSEKKFSIIYIKNKNNYKYYGKKRICFLNECLEDLKISLKKNNIELEILEGKSIDIFKEIIDKYKIISLYANKQYEPYCIERDENIKKLIEFNNGTAKFYHDTTLFEPQEIVNISGKSYSIFTPYKKNALSMLNKNHLKNFNLIFDKIRDIKKEKLDFLKHYDVSDKTLKTEKSSIFKGGRSVSEKYLEKFISEFIYKYSINRNFPSLNETSHLSPYIHFGVLGIREITRNLMKLRDQHTNQQKINSIDIWFNELLWREFYYNITYNNPFIINYSFKRKYDNILWSEDIKMFKKWCEGKTGYPIVDAGMRQLNKEGWMHNRLRMITAMFLTKDLFIYWKKGEKYFAENLIDMDFCSNNGGWQWSASTGCDAQPYFRIFNPVMQSKKYDSKGLFIKRYVEELKNVPDKYIHTPWLMSKEEQNTYGIIIGKDYPYPVVDHNKTRNNVLNNFKKIN